MDTDVAIACLAALAQPTRLEAFRLLVRSEPAGIAAGELARRLAAPRNTLSAHLNILAHARLVTSARKGRSIVYRANLARLRETTLFLLRDCCEGRAEVCAPIVAELSPCCADKEAEPA